MAISPAPEGSPGSWLHRDLHWLFARLKQGLATAETAAVREHGMTLWGYTVLMAIVEAPARTQLALAQAVSVDKSKLVLILDELESAGLVRRRPDPADRRARIIEVTSEGSRALKAARGNIEAIEDRLLADLTPSARTALKSALQDLIGEPIARVEDGRPHETVCAPGQA
ncbi:MarR family winged helix-turn-helix transcriptional regulator [Streptosporangium sp. NBC_01755]|uniref:MarR family winged helix-turn-helix transcriptional regulator n=1 Tax=unclassified Streptosporangium TaxID=2632669 RepID=UPI002DD93412|nr:MULTISPECIES: MarR family winged helix-turn-helix transcriptional regulator [unclassified Streptosporangium]WSA28728.1 MarR family winged helix-turn-helix transcriptional regulator [Streptosporangium sp. NBC_01810]WSC99818.1 MarR family winged helix-turn-helix transcriptional regulator [Streptosporangium sp. NBC_01755]